MTETKEPSLNAQRRTILLELERLHKVYQEKKRAKVVLVAEAGESARQYQQAKKNAAESPDGARIQELETLLAQVKAELAALKAKETLGGTLGGEVRRELDRHKEVVSRRDAAAQECAVAYSEFKEVQSRAEELRQKVMFG